MSENNGTRANLVRVLKPLHAIPVENRVREGTPDVNCRYGWIECKRLSNWPPFPGSRPVRLKHPILDTQIRWINKRAKTGEQVLVCLQVYRDWFFFDGVLACQKLGNMTKPEMFENCLLHMKGLNGPVLMDWMRKHWNATRSFL
jgi:hypothetical protein